MLVEPTLLTHVIRIGGIDQGLYECNIKSLMSYSKKAQYLAERGREFGALISAADRKATSAIRAVSS